MTKEEAMKLALDRSEPSILSPGWTLVRDEDIAAMREALAEQPAQQDSTCSNALRAQGKAYPRTCKKCGLGPCVELAQQALDKKAENARELGLDYEPAQQEPWPEEPAGHKAGGVQLSGTSKSKAITELYALFGAPHNADINLTGLNMLLDALITSPPAQRTWVNATTWRGLTDEELSEVYNQADWDTVNGWEYERAIEAKLRSKNEDRN